MAGRLVRSGLSAAAAVLLLEPACGVRLAKPGGQPLEAVKRRSQKLSQCSGSELQSASVPQNVSLFEKAWTTFAERGRKVSLKDTSDLTMQERARSRVPGNWPRVVIGVFSVAGCKDEPYREVIRSTWVQEPHVCPITELAGSTEKDNGCRFFVTFVEGSNGTRGLTDVTVLPVEENMDCGKSLAWFRHASETYKDATHIAKMDMDTYPHLAYIHEKILQPRPCENAFGGRTWSACGMLDGVSNSCHCKQEYCPKQTCGHPVGDDFMKYAADDEECYSYMQGGFYFMTAELASKVSKKGGWWDNEVKNCYPEDIITGHAISNHAKAAGICVAAIKLEDKFGYFHPDHPAKWGDLDWAHTSRWQVQD